MPLDCCTRPLFDAPSKPGVVHAVTQWLQKTGVVALTRLRVVFSRRQRSAGDVPLVAVCDADRDAYAEEVLHLEESTESAAVEERTPVSV
jgi:hypothetical protein